MLRYLQELVRTETRRQVLIILIVFAAMVVLCYEIGEPYIGFHDWNDALFSIMAINHNTYGFHTTHFMNVYPFPTDTLSFSYFIKHPPLLSILLSLNFRILGVYEWSARLFAIVFSLGSIVLLYLLVRRIYDENTALLSGFFMAFLPMTSYFGRMVCHEPLVLFFILTSLYGYRLWMENGRCRWALLMFTGFILGALTDWPVYFLAPLITIHFLMVTRGNLNRYNFGYILALPLIAAFLFILYLAYAAEVKGSIDELVISFFYRTGSVTGDPSVTSSRFTMWEFIIKELNRSVMYFTPVCLFLSAIWAYNYIKMYINKEPHFGDSYLFLLYSLGLLYVLVFKQGAWIHVYYGLYYLSPAVALSSSIGLIYLHRLLPCFTSMKATSITIFTILLIFLVWSLIFTAQIHNWDDPNLYDLGTMLNEGMSLDENFMATPYSLGCYPSVVYYAKRYPLEVPDQEAFETALIDPTKKYRYIVTEPDPTDAGLGYMLFHNYSIKSRGDPIPGLSDGYVLFDINTQQKNESLSRST